MSGGTSAAPNKLKQNLSNTGTAGSTLENGGAEYRLAGFIRNDGGGNKADNIAIPTTTSPAKCTNFPATNTTKDFAVEGVCE